MIAFQFVSTDPKLKTQSIGLDLANVDSYLRYYFIDTDKQGATTTNRVIPAVLCNEKYMPTEDYETDLIEQFERSADHMTEWLCPNITSFTLLNHPETYTYGRDFKLVVDFCDEKEPTCIQDEVKRQEYLAQIRLNSKVIF